jgi:hypothetical protein
VQRLETAGRRRLEVLGIPRSRVDSVSAETIERLRPLGYVR